MIQELSETLQSVRLTSNMNVFSFKKNIVKCIYCPIVKKIQKLGSTQGMHMASDHCSERVNN